MKYFYITNNIEIVSKLDNIGLDMVWIDLEKNGKYERQKNMDSVKSNHSLEDIKKIKPILKNSKLLVRVNPIFQGSKFEIDKAIEYGADIIMLPMFKTKKEVEMFFKLIDNRCETILLLETKEAVEDLDDILEIRDITNIHIGLNDLSLSYGNNFMFEPLGNGLVEIICEKLSKRKITYGFGGVGKLQEGVLPAKLILSEHIRLKSSQVILSRSFAKYESFSDISEFEKNFSLELEKIKEYERKLMEGNQEQLLINKKKLIKCLQNITMKNN